MRGGNLAYCLRAFLYWLKSNDRTINYPKSDFFRREIDSPIRFKFYGNPKIYKMNLGKLQIHRTPINKKL
ncbi:hypothetical protein SAMN04488514_107169 [Kriegella aquimaris]|uniref:Uncharacterized protein n=1 Tax=Kriegella aquimaris TaxID=192904 RepID=A0A1G9S932_9FLAO|nr:hypothetical protein SAMN04488514_107169 [Kriegella aquimaris]